MNWLQVLGCCLTNTNQRQSWHAPGGHHEPCKWNLHDSLRHNPGRGPVIYVWEEADQLRAFAFNGTTFDMQPVDMSSANVITPPESMPGAMLALYVDGSKPGTGIVWTSHPTKDNTNQGVVAGTLRAI